MSTPSDPRPHFIDNRNGLTLDKALCEHLRVLRERGQFVFSLDIATAFFNVPGFDLLAEEFFRTASGGLVTGSSNLTYAGLRKNLELNLGHFDVPAVPRVEVWFDELWENAELFDLAAIYDRLMAEFPPYLIYLRVLFALYGEELAEEEREEGHIPLTTFQQHGVWRAMRILKKCGGVLIADGVGLGKTFLAGALI